MDAKHSDTLLVLSARGENGPSMAAEFYQTVMFFVVQATIERDRFRSVGRFLAD
jgi:hypothetical protein